MAGRPYSTREAEEAEELQRAGEAMRTVPGIPRPIAEACAHVLYAAAGELRNGRSFGIEPRRAARHLLESVRKVAGEHDLSVP